MVGFDLCYLLPSVPIQLARTYLARIFQWNISIQTKLPLTVFVNYYLGSPPSSFQEVTNQFPANCLLATSPSHHQRLILAAGHIEFGLIYQFISKLPCQALYQQLDRELQRIDEPVFKIRDLVWKADQPRLMGILNVTPDSFYDGGVNYELPDYAVVAEQMIQAGADIIDIGGESSRPGAQPVSEEEEIKRILPAVKQIRDRYHIPISIDTVKTSVADAMLEMGGDMINDISGLSAGREMISVVKKHNASYCLMHILGKPQNMQKNPQYFDSVSEIYHFLKEKLRLCNEEGLENERILIDPGIGFGKTVLNNLDLLRFTTAFRNLNCLVMIGTSNKSFISKTMQREASGRLPGTLATSALGWLNGATVFRVHDVSATRDAVSMARFYTNEMSV